MKNILKDEKKSVVIWGTKLEAEKILFQLQMKNIRCEYVIDDSVKGKFHGYEIKTSSCLKNFASFCIVACSNVKTYLEIKNTANGLGLVEFEHFIWSKLWDKKLVVINANCHGTALKKYLEHSMEFNKNYAIYPIPEVQLNEKKEIEERILNNADIYIHQDIKRDNKISERLSDDYILPRLKKNCIEICIPNFVGYGNIYHQYIVEGGYATRGDNPILLIFQDLLLDSIYWELKGTNEQLRLCDFLTKLRNYNYSFDENFEKNLERLKAREVNWDIKVSKYIMSHQNEPRLFNDINHPGNALMKYICDEVIKKLGCQPIEYNQFSLGAEVPSVPYVNGFEDSKFKIRDDNKGISLTDQPYENYADYVKQYIWLMYDEYLE